MDGGRGGERNGVEEGCGGEVEGASEKEDGGGGEDL